MTTTSTYQGMDSESKPSSRVLNPPGGASSNIFGASEDSNRAAPGRTPVRNNPDNVNRGNNDIFNRSQHAAEGTPHVRNNPDNVNRGNNDIFNREHHAAPVTPHHKSQAPRSAYNPITGELYEEPKKSAPPQQQPPAEPQPQANNNGAADYRDYAASTDYSPVEETQCAPPAAEQEAPAQTAEQPAAGQAPQHLETRQSAGNRRNQGSGIFDAPEPPAPHRSTRVSQPPGGRSTKLW